MRRRRPIQTLQANIRLDAQLIAQLEKRAKANRTNFSEEIRARLIDSLNPRPEPGLADFGATWVSRLRDALEAGAPEDIEAIWRAVRVIETVFAGLYGTAETELLPWISNPKIRELLRGVLALPDETKSQQE
jgi:hypothetical protein